MEVLKLPTKIRERVIKVENEIKEKYLEIVRNMPTDELRKFNKFKYRDLMAIDMSEALENTVAEQIIRFLGVPRVQTLAQSNKER